MTDIDAFASTLLEEAKQFLEKSRTETEGVGREAYTHAALMLAFCALEAHVNAICDEFVEQGRGLSAHEIGILQERAVHLEDGEFRVTTKLQIARLEDRIQFLHRKFSGSPINRSQVWWSELLSALGLRNQLTHPKGVPIVTVEAVGRAIQAIIDVLDAVYQAVYRRRFPAASRGHHSRLNF